LHPSVGGGKTDKIKYREKEQNFECYEFALQDLVKKFIRLMTMDISKVYTEYVYTNKKGWIKGKVRITYPVESEKHEKP
jgi:hypothetical protein